MSKHTKGPWKSQGNLIFSIEHKHIAKLYALPREIGESTAQEESANAKLIAAAPDLLETCKWVRGCLENLPKNTDIVSALRELNKVITEAEGNEK